MSEHHWATTPEACELLRIREAPEKSYGTDVAPGLLTITHVPSMKAFRVSLSNYKPIIKKS